MSGARGARAIRSAFVVWDRPSPIRIRLERGGSTGGTGVSRVAGAVSVMCALLGSVRSSECRGHGREARGDFSFTINVPRQIVTGTCTVVGGLTCKMQALAQNGKTRSRDTLGLPE